MNPRLSNLVLLLLVLLAPGCGNQTGGKSRNSLGAPEFLICSCAGGGLFLLLATPIAIFLLTRRSKSAPPPGDAGQTSSAAPHIFISYRRNDSQDVAGRIYDVLVQRFSKDNIFKDVDSIPAGKDFRKVLRAAVTRAELIIVVIGPRWTHAKNAAGQRRLEDPNDFVRIEIESALAEGIPIIPVMVSNAKMASAADLPESIQQLVFQNGIPVRPDPDFHRDMERLVAAIEKMFPGSKKAAVGKQASSKSTGTGLWLGGCAVLAALLVGGLVLLALLYIVVAAMAR